MEEATREALNQYVRDLFAPEDDLLASIRSESAERGLPQIHVRPEEGQMLHFLLKVVGARRVIEIGTLAGYSGTWIARALPPDGRLITLDVNPDHASFAGEIFQRAGLADLVEIRLGEASQSLATLAREGPFDAVFIDADKDAYPEYLTWAIENIRIGGLILAHNVFARGAVVGAIERDPGQLKGIMDFNAAIASDPRLAATIIPVGDGIAAAVRLPG